MENIIVIGGGLMGSSVAWKLSSYGEKVLLIEQQSANYNGGSSYGEARISRSLGPKKDIFSFVQQRTIEETEKLLRFLNGLNNRKKHKMKDVYHTSPVTYLYDQNQKEELDKLLYKKQKDKYRKAIGDAAFRKFGLTVPDSYLVIREYKKFSGTLNPKALIKKLRLGIEKKNNTIQYNRKATRIVKRQGFYEVKVLNTKTGKSKILQAKKVIIAAGPYTVPLLKKMAPYFDKFIIPKRVLLSFFKISKKRSKQLDKIDRKNLIKAHPVFDQHGKMFFSMIEKIDKSGRPLFKVGGHQMRRNITNLDRVWRDQPIKKEVKWARKAFQKYLEMLEIYVKKKELEYIKGYNCVYSMSKTKIPFVTNILTKDNIIDSDIVVVGGMSGVGAKGCLGYALLAADLLLGTSESSKIYQKSKKELGSPLLRLQVKKRKSKLL